MERLPGLVVLEGRALQVHAQFRGPDGGGVGAGAPPDAVAQALRIGLETQQARRVGEHRTGVGLREALAAEHVEEHFGVTPAHVGVALALLRKVAEVAPTVDHLLRRAPADSQLQPAARNEVGRAGLLGHIERVLVAHVDDRRADFDTAGLRTHGGQQRETAKRAGGRSDAHGNRRRPRRSPRPRPQGRWIAEAHRRPSASATAVRASSARTKGNRSSS